jgi:hypothetical protein
MWCRSFGRSVDTQCRLQRVGTARSGSSAQTHGPPARPWICPVCTRSAHIDDEIVRSVLVCCTRMSVIPLHSKENSLDAGRCYDAVRYRLQAHRPKSLCAIRRDQSLMIDSMWQHSARTRVAACATACSVCWTLLLESRAHKEAFMCARSMCRKCQGHNASQVWLDSTTQYRSQALRMQRELD